MISPFHVGILALLVLVSMGMGLLNLIEVIVKLWYCRSVKGPLIASFLWAVLTVVISYYMVWVEVKWDGIPLPK